MQRLQAARVAEITSAKIQLSVRMVAMGLPPRTAATQARPARDELRPIPRALEKVARGVCNVLKVLAGPCAARRTPAD
jgi:hypothetical protein